MSFGWLNGSILDFGLGSFCWFCVTDKLFFALTVRDSRSRRVFLYDHIFVLRIHEKGDANTKAEASCASRTRDWGHVREEE